MSRRVLNASCLCSEKWLLDYRSPCLSWVQWLFGKGGAVWKNKQALGERQTGRSWGAAEGEACVRTGVRAPACASARGEQGKEDEGKESCTAAQRSDSSPNCYGDPKILWLLIAPGNFNVSFYICSSLALGGLLESKMGQIPNQIYHITGSIIAQPFICFFKAIGVVFSVRCQ